MCQSSTKSSAKTHEIMGKLWLQHEIEVLEAKMSKNRMILPPYIIVDTKALTNYLDIVKKFVKTKKTVVLIPKAGKNNTNLSFISEFRINIYLYRDISSTFSFGRIGRHEKNIGHRSKHNSLVGI